MIFFSNYWSAFAPLSVLWYRIFAHTHHTHQKHLVLLRWTGRTCRSVHTHRRWKSSTERRMSSSSLISRGEAGEAAVRGRPALLHNHLRSPHCNRLFQMFREKIFQHDQVHTFNRQKIQGLISTTKTKLRLSSYIYRNFIHLRNNRFFNTTKKFSPSRLIIKGRTRITM